ncbi:hypothetical protein D3C85_1853240 [compost metagenome]
MGLSWIEPEPCPADHMVFHALASSPMSSLCAGRAAGSILFSTRDGVRKLAGMPETAGV